MEITRTYTSPARFIAATFLCKLPRPCSSRWTRHRPSLTFLRTCSTSQSAAAVSSFPSSFFALALLSPHIVPLFTRLPANGGPQSYSVVHSRRLFGEPKSIRGFPENSWAISFSDYTGDGRHVTVTLQLFFHDNKRRMYYRKANVKSYSRMLQLSLSSYQFREYIDMEIGRRSMKVLP